MSEFWDNLIPIRSSLSGEQLAGWEPKCVAMRGLGCHLLADQRIPVDGGVQLSADVYTPNQRGRYPAVVQFAAYSRELHTAGVPTGSNEIGSPPVFTDRGYAPVVVTRRGMGRSQGEAGVFFNAQDVRDHERCIEWAAEQPWCDGNVVLFGTSYYGMTQLLVAARRPPALKAFFCNEISTDYFAQDFQFGGVPALYFMNLWMGAVSAHLTFSCNDIDSHIVARLGRVAADGTYYQLSMGTLSPARRRRDAERSTMLEIAIDTEHPAPLTPGEPTSLSFSLTPAPTRLRPGERLRLEVASRTDLLRSDVSHGRVHFDLPAPPYFSRNTLHYGPKTYLELYRCPA